MPTEFISFKETNYFSSLICDYLDEKEELSFFYNRFPRLENFKQQIDEKQSSFSEESRTILASELKAQYDIFNATDLTLSNIEALRSKNTFTITTGHQLNLFTGPLYFLYKIISVINLTKELTLKYPEFNFVPVYWMASEDHDFDEINFFNFKGNKIQWDRHSSGGVGRIENQGLDKVLKHFEKVLGLGKNADELSELFEQAYLKHKNLSEATRYIANKLFGNYGLVVIDADKSDLKRLFSPYIKKEFLEQISYQEVSKTNDKLNALGKNYSIQVNPREINLFYLKDNLRERIVKNDKGFTVKNTDIVFTKDEILVELETHPERFSPNVIMRPLYQEVVLPNLCYIGGGGELAYWMQLKSYFNKVNVVYPILLLRNSVLVRTFKQKEKQEKLELSLKDIFLKQEDLINTKIKGLSKIKIDFSDQKTHLKKQFKELYKIAEQTDKSFIGAVGAQERKQIKGLEHLEKRLLKAQKRKLKTELDQITSIQNELFPNKGLQERNLNFSELYLEYGKDLIKKLLLNLKPLKGDFMVLDL